MNLHNLPFNRSAWIWIWACGRNGAGLGDHLWELEQGEPPELETDPTRRDRWYRPTRYNWHPFTLSLNTFFRNGWVPPLCGRRSRSRNPRVEFSWREAFRMCPDCQRIANERGIIGIHYAEFTSTNPEYQALIREGDAWIRANTTR